MSIRLLNTSYQALTLNTDPLNYNLPYTFMCWFQAHTWPPADNYRSLLIIGEPTDPSGDQLQITNLDTINEFDLYVNRAGAFSETYPNLICQSGVWYHATMVRSGVARCLAIINGVYSCESTFDVSTRKAATQMNIGRNPHGGEYIDGRVAAIKAWNTALTRIEIRREMSSVPPIRTTNLYGCWPGYPGQHGKDYSGNQHDFTEVGSPTDEAPPPVVWNNPPPKIWWLGEVGGITFQYLRPSADTSLGSWTDEADGATNIYTHIDETSPSDADYVQSPNNPSANIYKFKISTGSDPTVHTNHIISYRYRKPDNLGTVNLKVRLVEGTTTRKEWTHNDIGTTWTTQEQTLTEGEAATITDYSNLYLELEA